jgi:uncharacterized protein
VSSSAPPSAQARNWASVAHLSALAIFTGAPFGNVLGPLIVYLIKKEDDPFIAFAGREALNFQIFVSILGFFLFAVYVSTFFFTFFSLVTEESKMYMPILPFLVLPFFFVLALFDVVNVIVAAVRANKGVAYRYPITVRFVR